MVVMELSGSVTWCESVNMCSELDVGTLSRKPEHMYILARDVDFTYFVVVLARNRVGFMTNVSAFTPLCSDLPFKPVLFTAASR
jgi:hypothetical protein